MALDYQLDRKVRFLGESEHKSLYKWSLQEFDEAGKKIGSPQVPWSWSLVFTATELKLHETLKLGREAPPLLSLKPVLEDLKDWKTKTEEHEFIGAELRPGYHKSDDDDVAYSMFGTSRPVKEFALNIHKLKDEDEEEYAHAWGSVQYSYEGADFGIELSEDTVQFYLHVRPSRFAHYSEMIRNYPASIVSLRLGTVLGMYSEWSPTTKTNRVKVLTRSEDHKLEIAADATIKPGELGPIFEFEITFSTIREALKRPEQPVDDQKEELEAIMSGESTTSATLAQQAALQIAIQQRDRSKQLVFLAWVVVALLAVLVFRR